MSVAADQGTTDPPRRVRRALGPLLLLLAVALVLPAGFVWGYQTHRERVFPYWTLRKAVESTRPQRKERPTGVQEFTSRALAVDALEDGAADAAALAEIGYVDGTYDASADEVLGVYRHDPDAAFQGLNLYFSRFSVGAALLDMGGTVVHQWHGEVEGGPWQNVYLLDDGSVLVIVKAQELLKVDRNSKVLWRVAGDFHHDLDVRSDGTIFVLGKWRRTIDAISPTTNTIDPLVVEITADGTIVSETSITEVLLASPYRSLLPAPRRAVENGPAALDGTGARNRSEALDILHANHIEVMEGNDPVFGSGNFLISMRTNSLVAVLDSAVERVLWIWGPGNLTNQHHPSLLDNGHLLVFDNGVRRSRVVELDPRTFQIVWQYGPNDDFYSKLQGSCQRLPNGNTLITESESGYVFEVTREGEIVWGFANPAVREGKVREAIWRMTRLSRTDAPWLANAAGTSG